MYQCSRVKAIFGCAKSRITKGSLHLALVVVVGWAALDRSGYCATGVIDVERPTNERSRTSRVATDAQPESSSSCPIDCRSVKSGAMLSIRAARVQCFRQRQRFLPWMKPCRYVLGRAPDRAPTSRVLVTSSRSRFRRTTPRQRVQVDSSARTHAGRRRVSSPPSAHHSVATGY